MKTRSFLVVAIAVVFLAQALFARGAAWAGVFAIAVGWAFLWRSGWRCPEPEETVRRPRWGRYLGPAIFMLALALRLWRLDSIPPVWWDEGVEGYDARCIASGAALEPLEGIHYHRGPLWLAILAACGATFDFSIFALRAAAATAGSLLALGCYAAGTRLFGSAAGVLAGLLVAFHPWGLNMSRIMIGNILVPLAGTAIVIVCFERRIGPIARGAVVGAISGLSMYGYAAAAQLPVLGAAALWIAARGSVPVRPRAAAVAVSIAIAGAIAIPYGLVYPGLWDKTANVSALSDPVTMMKNGAATLGMFHVQGDADLRHQYPAGAPVLDGLIGPLFTIGVGAAALSIAEPRFAVLLLWLLLGLSPGIASVGGGANLFRMVGAIPAVALVVSAGALTIPAVLGFRLAAVVTVAIWSLSGLASWGRYFVDFPADAATAVWYRTHNAEAAGDLKDLASRAEMVLCRPLSLATHPLEKFFLFGELKSGRVTEGGRCPVGGRTRIYRDPWGQPAAILVVGGEAGGRTRVEYRTIMDIGAEGDGMIADGRAAEAMTLYRGFLSRVPDSAALRERLGFAALGAGDHESAIEAFEMAINGGSRLPATYNGLAAALLRAGRHDEAEAAIGEALRLSPGDPDLEADLERVRRGRSASKHRVIE